MPYPTAQECIDLVHAARAQAPADRRTIVLPVWATMLDDQLTPVLAYRRLVAPDERTAPSFLFESVEGGERQGRFSILGAQPALEVIARGNEVRLRDHRASPRRTAAREPGEAPAIHGETVSIETDPLDVPRRIARDLRLVIPPKAPHRPAPPACFLGGWVGYAAYDSVRYAEPDKLPWTAAPRDDRGLPDLQFQFYDGVVIFDHVTKSVHAVRLIQIAPDDTDARIREKFQDGHLAIERRVQDLQSARTMRSGRTDRSPDTTAAPGATPDPGRSNMSRPQHAAMLGKALEYIRAGDIFQVVLGQRFERRSHADPFDVYRALRAVNPSPYMVYLQAESCLLIASSPEILCRVRHEPGAARPVVTNRPLAGTRRRGGTAEEDTALEKDLLSDPKELAEHIMLVDLGRNDVGQVARPGSIRLPAVLQIERYSHVMHISSTVTGELREGLDCWDALRAALPVGTISGAPKIRAMQIIDELEPVRRGPYGGGMGAVGLDGQMDIALALRTIVVPVRLRSPDGQWTYHLQASGGIVADSQVEAEYQETVNKAAALSKSIETAERAFES